MIACENGHTGIVELLLDSGAVVNLCSNNGIGPLYKASKNGYEIIVYTAFTTQRRLCELYV